MQDHIEGHNGKRTQNLSHLVTEDGNSEDPIDISHLQNLSDQDFREEVLCAFKGTMEQTIHELKRI